MRGREWGRSEEDSSILDGGRKVMGKNECVYWFDALSPPSTAFYGKSPSQLPSFNIRRAIAATKCGVPHPRPTSFPTLSSRFSAGRKNPGYWVRSVTY